MAGRNSLTKHSVVKESLLTRYVPETYFTLHFAVCLMYQVLTMLFFIDGKMSRVPNFVFR